MASAAAPTPMLPPIRRYVRANSDLAQRMYFVRRKHVQFSTVTTFEFKVDYGGSAVPTETGPPIGLARRHWRAKTTAVANATGVVRKFDHFERIQLLKQAKYDVKDIAAFCLDAVAARAARMETRAELLQERSRKRPIDRIMLGNDDEEEDMKPPQRLRPNNEPLLI
ncbi:hypothetical protein SPRG_01302 [Saprolegnia parasitica CBS 223.65]|uniref:Cysteine/serine-rich nuclear protein N-terminal domain-containing protein n=1 Tax=Saprolegnia parasitica (strain CBS 223.65) TaxID=695850 RepID=A0A067CU26_SAPPC|nr:hypothetical protein SPRG_01302 [Saprolegnia parasitica CBS 223.65]KDO34028.1 hypothetical protein SPRG_01302 [Saprolegnia parasitica CBS 223.65]|eukprot:XP_012194913.1 hypothetical protein SPRG_01302 [Saprolegnia parasitica CBS 223.65]